MDAQSQVVDGEQASSIVVFPKIVADGTRDTIVQITNVGFLTTRARCVYLNGIGRCEQEQTICAGSEDCLLPNDRCVPSCQTTDFEIVLLAQQPTNWVVSRGRPLDSNDPACSMGNTNCYGAGNDPGHIVPQAEFRGSLLCVATDADSAPIAMNSLVGTALLEELATGDVARYRALGFSGGTQDSDHVLVLGEEYAGCPDSWLLDHATPFAPDDHLSGYSDSLVRTSLTLLPCTLDFENALPQSATLLIRHTDEFELVYSQQRTATCWQEIELGAFPFSGSAMQTRLSTVGKRCRGGPNNDEPCVAAADCAGSPCRSSGVLLLGEEIRESVDAPQDVSAFSMVNAHHEGVRAEADEIRLSPFALPVADNEKRR